MECLFRRRDREHKDLSERSKASLRSAGIRPIHVSPSRSVSRRRRLFAISRSRSARAAASRRRPAFARDGVGTDLRPHYVVAVPQRGSRRRLGGVGRTPTMDAPFSTLGTGMCMLKNVRPHRSNCHDLVAFGRKDGLFS
jgi:hypothetical protein